MIHRVMIRAPIILLPLLALGARAQDSGLEEEPVEVRRYTVELMIFAYGQSISVGSEIFVPDEPPPSEYGVDEDLIDFVFGDETMPAEVARFDDPDLTEVELILHERQLDVDDRYAFVILPEEDFVLLDIVAGLDERDAYVPLMHFGWTQPMIPDEEPEVRLLSSFATPPDGLEGDLSLYLSRYLHLAVNLQMDSRTLEKMGGAEEAQDRVDSYNYGDGINAFGFDDNGGVTYPVRYVIEEDRIVRNGELRYYDHPKFGVLAKITREEAPDESEEELEEELLGLDRE